MLLSSHSMVRWNYQNVKWYENKGYIFTKYGDKFEVKVEDLSDGSNSLVKVQCDGCGKIMDNVKWISYIRSVRNGKYFCIKCAHNGHKKWINFEEWCYINLSKEKADKILSRWDYKKNIKNGKVLSPKDVSFSSEGFNKRGYWFKCHDNPEHKSELKSINRFVNNNEGDLCCNQCNTIAAVHPELIIYLVNKEDAFNYSYGTNTKLLVRCPNCGYEKSMVICALLRQDFSCPRCSEYLPFSERFMICLLEQLNIDFKTQLNMSTFEWCEYYKYDVYVHSVNSIIEIHGKQHYEEVKGWRMSLKEIQENDKNKENLAIANGIKNYIVIDCRKPTIDWIKNSVMHSELPKLLDFEENDIDWIKCLEIACPDTTKDACNLWNSGIKNISEIANKLQISLSTIRVYLNRGSELGWCDYDPKEELIRNYISKFKMVICLTTGKIFNSQKEAEKYYNIHRGGVSACCKGFAKSAGKHPETGERLKWAYYKEE